MIIPIRCISVLKSDWLLELHRVIFNFEALKGVVIFPQSLISSPFFKIDDTVNPVKSNSLKALNCFCPAEVCQMTFNFTAINKLFICIFTGFFFLMLYISVTYSSYWNIYSSVCVCMFTVCFGMAIPPAGECAKLSSSSVLNKQMLLLLMLYLKMLKYMNRKIIH